MIQFERRWTRVLQLSEDILVQTDHFDSRMSCEACGDAGIVQTQKVFFLSKLFWNLGKSGSKQRDF